MRIQHVASLSGLSKGQIDQLISRHGVAVHGGVAPGSARDFTPADAFAFCVAGRASAMGVSMPAIRYIIASLPMPALDPATDRQLEIFPGYHRDRDVVLVVYQAGGDWQSLLVHADRVPAATKNVAVALIFPATKIARAIEDATSE